MKFIHIYMIVFGLFIQSAVIGQIQSVSLQASGPYLQHVQQGDI